LPLPVFASVFFIVLAIGARQLASAPPETGALPTPTIGQLWAQAETGLLDTGVEYPARDVIASLREDQGDVTVTFGSLRSQSFILEDFDWAVTTFDLGPGSDVAALFEYIDGNWTVGYILPANLVF
jgi:hypothetical protein